MHLLQAVLFRRSVLQWLVPLVALWVTIICGLAFSSAALAEAEARDPHVVQPGEPAAASIAYSNLVPPEQHSKYVVVSSHRPIAEILSDNVPKIHSDPEVEAYDLLRVRDPVEPIQERLVANGECQTPMSLMLHSSFGTQRMKQLAREILRNGLVPITYREVTEGLRRGQCPPSNSIIVSLDDFGTDWLRPHFRSMIRVFSERGLRLVVAVVVHGPQDPDTWDYLRELEELGNEVANHTVDHYNLARLEADQIRWQVKGAHQIICLNLGRCPETLVLPFGINEENGFVVEAAADYSYIVGIPGGRAFGGEAPFYLGRIAPDNFDQRVTLSELAASFGGKPSTSSEILALRATSGRGCSVGPNPSAAVPFALCGPSETRANSADLAAAH